LHAQTQSQVRRAPQALAGVKQQLEKVGQIKSGPSGPHVCFARFLDRAAVEE